MQPYNHKQIESKWQKIWEEQKLNQPDLTCAKKPFYNLMMYPYPSAEGLHVGNMYAFTGADAYGRFKRLQGFQVFEPIGFDSGGIHSENFAIKMGVHPKVMTERNIKNFTRQLHTIGAMYDWRHTVDAMDPNYYKWTQWIFVRLFKQGLAYKKEGPVTWCPSCKTTLSDEQTEKKKIKPPATSHQPPVANDMRKEKMGNGKLEAGDWKLATNEVTVCERCKTPIEKRKMKQWFFKITDYAERLLENIKKLNWSEKVLTAQRNWIGKSEGINIEYEIEGHKDKKVVCFTTRPDTNFGATFVVLAPEHPLIDQITTKDNKKAVGNYVRQALAKSELERIAEGREKSGIFTGAYAVNNLTGMKMPIWVSDFVLGHVGTGAVVGVPGHDRRDFEFARKFDIPVVRVVVGSDGDTSEIARVEQVQEEEGIIINSEFLNGLDIREATQKIMDYLEEKGWGKRTVTYKLRDWCISRQRYWGPPIPMVYCPSCADRGESWFTTEEAKKYEVRSMKYGVRKKKSAMSFRNSCSMYHASLDSAGWYPVPEDRLPVELPFIDDYLPDGLGKAPLAKHPEFYETACPNCGGKAQRETDVSDTFLDSSWYFLRYPFTDFENEPFDLTYYRGRSTDYRLQTTAKGKDTVVGGRSTVDLLHKWLPVDQYTGGAEHSVLHLMYSRFITMALHDMGYLEFEEPFPTFYAHGLIIKDGAKMSKSRGNIVNPDEYIEKYGADALRMYLMFIGPFSQGGDFRDTGMKGMYRFVKKIYSLAMRSITYAQDSPKQEDQEVWLALERTTQTMAKDFGKFKYNTAIARLMEFVTFWSNSIEKTGPKVATRVAILLAPLAPHLAEEIFQAASRQLPETSHLSLATRNQREENNETGDRSLVAGRFTSVHQQTWPEIDEKLIQDQEVTVIVQVNGKKRGELNLGIRDTKLEEKVVSAAKANERVKLYLAGKTISKTIFVPGKLINFVTQKV